MSTRVRTELSKQNKYYIDKQRRLELVHFCLQYKTWKKEILNIEDKFQNGIIYEKESPEHIDKLKRRFEYYKRSVAMVENAAVKTDPELAIYLLKAVTEDLTFSAFEMQGIPCSRSTYYRRFHKFFWVLDDMRL